MLTRYTNSLRSSAGLPCARLRQHSVTVGVSGQESVASRCATAAAAFITTHSFNGWRCCPIPTFAQTSLGNSFASSLHSHVASMHRRLIGLTFIAHRMKARNLGCLDDDKRFPVSAPWVRRGTRSIAPMPAPDALIQSFVRAVLTWRHRTVTSPCGRRHFFDGVATNCLNNSKSAPLSPSSSPLRTASSSPPIAVYYLAKASDRCCREDQYRQADFGSHDNDLTAHHSHIPLGGRGRSRKND